MSRPITGRTVLAIFVGAFSIIIAVNVTMAVNAVRTFPGLETKNSYVASQTFDAERKAQDALGWTVSVDLIAPGVRLDVTRAGLPVRLENISAVLGRTTEAVDDRTLDFRPDGDGYVALADLAPGRWLLRLQLTDANGGYLRRNITMTR